MFYKEKPIDWLLDHILWVKVCNPEKDAVCFNCSLSPDDQKVTQQFTLHSRLFFFQETLRAAEVQPARAIPSVPLPTRGTSFFSRWKDPKAHSKSHASLQLFSAMGQATSCVDPFVSALHPAGQGLPEAPAAQDARQPAS